MTTDNFIGKKFGRLTVIKSVDSYIWVDKKTGRSTHRKKYLCKCDCGNDDISSLNFLKRKLKTKCKSCAYKERPQSLRRVSAEQRLYNVSIKNRCESQNIENNLEIDDFKLIIYNKCFYCDAPPRKIDWIYKNKVCKSESVFANGVDRLNSDKGYSIDNCVPCCPTCNVMKMDLNLAEFDIHIKKIYSKLIQVEEADNISNFEFLGFGKG